MKRLFDSPRSFPPRGRPVPSERPRGTGMKPTPTPQERRLRRERFGPRAGLLPALLFHASRVARCAVEQLT